MTTFPPPIIETLVDEKGMPTLRWVSFFDSLWRGDTGNVWLPNFVNLGISGVPTISGSYYRITQSFVYFSMVVEPATNTSSVAGTTYVDNFPLVFQDAGVCFATVGNVASQSVGSIDAFNGRIYTPEWTAITVPVLVCGVGLAR